MAENNFSHFMPLSLRMAASVSASFPKLLYTRSG